MGGAAGSLVIAAALVIGGGPASGGLRQDVPAVPQRIMSMNMCTDMLLLQLAPRAHVASVSYLARQGVAAFAPGLADGVPVNHGSAEEIVGLKPDLILAGDFSTPLTKRYARAMGARLVEVKTTLTFQDIRDVTRQVAAAVGEPARGEALIAQMDADLSRLAAMKPATPIRAVVWSEGAVPGRDTLANRIVEAAGATDIAAHAGPAYTTFGVEELLQANPDVLITGESSGRTSLHSMAAEHAAVRGRWRGREAAYPDTLASCGISKSAAAALTLRQALDRIAARGAR